MVDRPVRLQLSRRKGFDLQAHSRAINGLSAIHVARPSKWGNPWNWTEFYFPGRNTRADALAKAVRRFRAAVMGFDAGNSFCGPRAHPDSTIGTIITSAHELRGKNLACWCRPGEPCHADVLLELANMDEVTRP